MIDDREELSKHIIKSAENEMVDVLLSAIVNSAKYEHPTEVVETLDLLTDASTFWTGDDEDNHPGLKRLRTLIPACIAEVLGKVD